MYNPLTDKEALANDKKELKEVIKGLHEARKSYSRYILGFCFISAVGFGSSLFYALNGSWKFLIFSLLSLLFVYFTCNLYHFYLSIVHTHETCIDIENLIEKAEQELKEKNNEAS
jgi:hypothetical protein